ncbi:MAG: hypothetical protein AAB439_03795 [Patescibacteria group bacterium]
MIKKRYFAFVILSLLLLSVVGWFFFSKILLTDKREPTQILIGNYIKADAYEVGDEKLTPLPFINDGSVLARARLPNTKTTVSIVRWPNQIGNVIFLESAEGNKVISDASSIKDAISFSPDGTYVAYAELNVPFGSTLYSENISDWNVVLQNIDTEEKEVIGVGFKPYLVSENPKILIYSSPDGVVAYDYLLKDKMVLLPDRPVGYIGQAALVAPRGGHIAFFNPVTKRFSLYSVKGEFPFELSALGEVPAAVDAAALDAASFYGITRNQENNEFILQRYQFADFIEPAIPSEFLHTFEAGYVPYSIIP